MCKTARTACNAVIARIAVAARLPLHMCRALQSRQRCIYYTHSPGDPEQDQLRIAARGFICYRKSDILVTACSQGGLARTQGLTSTCRNVYSDCRKLSSHQPTDSSCHHQQYPCTPSDMLYALNITIELPATRMHAVSTGSTCSTAALREGHTPHYGNRTHYGMTCIAMIAYQYCTVILVRPSWQG
jgi:hypothetical protein